MLSHSALKTISLGFVLCSLFCGVNSSAHARPASAERSAYGKFVVQEKDGACQVTFKSNNGKNTDLLLVEDCSLDGIATLSGVEKIGPITLPLNTKVGDEFHLFSIESARGGNACYGYDYYAVVIQKELA